MAEGRQFTWRIPRAEVVPVLHAPPPPPSPPRRGQPAPHMAGSVRVADTARALGVPGRTIRRWLREGRLTDAQLGQPVISIPRAEVEPWQPLRAPPDAPASP